MRPFTQTELQELLSVRGGPCISIYLPVHRRHHENAQDAVRYRQLLDRAEKLLSSRSSAGEVATLLAPCRELADSEFWRHQEDGLAVFRSPDHFSHYRLTASVPELAVVADNFHTKPLVAYLHTERKFFLLALSRNHVSLFQGTKDRLVQVNLAGLPKNLRDALGVEEPIPHLGSHSGPGRSAIFHGHGAAETDRKDEVARYFRAIDRELWLFLRNERAPLVIAGVGEYHPIYHEVSRYPYLIDEGIVGNVDREKPGDLHARAWPLVAAKMAAEEDAVLANYAQFKGRGRASDDLGEIARAIFTGRVRHLFLQKGKQIWGIVHQDSGQVDVRDRQQDSTDSDILDELAEATLRRDGQVMILPAARMPSPSPVAAIYRF